MEMQFRIYGNAPYQIFVIHGGPGAPGAVSALAKTLSNTAGTIEPFLTENSLDGQIEEIIEQINFHAADKPVVLIGHSYGAMLSYMITAKFPEKVKQLIMVCSGVFTHKIWKKIRPLRNKRLTPAQQLEIEQLSQNPTEENFFKIGEIFDTIDNIELDKSDYAPLSLPGYDQAKIYQSVWPEIFELRKSGALLNLANKITCPVFAITGDFDPHPKDGILVLRDYIHNFKHIELKKCGHIPWCEINAKDKFYQIHLSHLNL